MMRCKEVGAAKPTFTKQRITHRNLLVRVHKLAARRGCDRWVIFHVFNYHGSTILPPLHNLCCRTSRSVGREALICRGRFPSGSGC